MGVFEIVTAGVVFQRKLRNVATCNVIFVNNMTCKVVLWYDMCTVYFKYMYSRRNIYWSNQILYHDFSHVMYHVIYVTARHVQWLIQILSPKHIKYQYYNASPFRYHVIYVTARHVQWLIQIPEQKHILIQGRVVICMCFCTSIWNIHCTCRAVI